MYSQAELDEAVRAGAVSAEAASSLREYFERQRSTAVVDEEQFRLLTGFNDIFVAVASAILLFAVGWIGQSIGASIGFVVDPQGGPSPLAPLAVAAVSWGLATYFTARRRMALPSILLLLSFAGAVFAAAGFSALLAIGPSQIEDNEQLVGLVAAIAGALAAAAAWLHWRAFRVPITVAVGTAAAAVIAVSLLVSAIGTEDNVRDIVLGFVLLLGIGAFLFAMWWDSSDRARMTRRTDVAFWLHLLAAPMIVHPIFTLLGLNDGNATIGEGLVVVGLYIVLGITALAVDRRALLVSALAYVLFALSELFQRFGAVELNVALTALLIGSALLLLSAFWNQARSTVVRPLPDRLRQRLPLIDRPAATPIPAA
ncbi:MAG: hypothetical protein M3Q52_04580 [Pseudomonadota bacterium]|nr:hypothetical protein [Pseudomonadota bacterium]